MDTHQNLEKGRFAGTVAAAECVNRAGAQLKATVAQSGNTAKGLLQPFHLQQKFHLLSSAYALGNPDDGCRSTSSIPALMSISDIIRLPLDKCQVAGDHINVEMATARIAPWQTRLKATIFGIRRTGEGSKGGPARKYFAQYFDRITRRNFRSIESANTYWRLFGRLGMWQLFSGIPGGTESKNFVQSQSGQMTALRRTE
jgi:hypothetical protein